MAQRKALVLGSDGYVQQLQNSDTIGINAFFTGSATLPAVSLLLPTTMTLAVSPLLAGDSLAAGERIFVTPGAVLPGGLNIAYAIATATNTVAIGLSSTVTLGLGAAPLSWTVTACR